MGLNLETDSIKLTATASKTKTHGMNEVSFSRAVKEVKFGAWTLDPKRQTIFDGEVTRELEPLLFKILCYLIINDGQVIIRQNLIDDVWCQKYVDDNAINRAMSELRKILKSDIQKGIVVKTHYRKGYSFFLEPEIIYHEEQLTEEVRPNTTEPKSEESLSPKAYLSSHDKNRSLSFYSSVILCLVLITVTGYFFTVTNYTKEEVVVESRDIEDSVLSWVPGRYANLRLSFDKKLLALSFIPQGTNFHSLVVKELASGYERRLGEDGVDYFPLGWSTDSSILYYRAKTDTTCQIWQIKADFSQGNKALFECNMRAQVYGSGVGKDRLVYSKSGYRNRDELAALTSRDLNTGAEFQISSPNLNSYGDQFLTYIPEQEIIFFERRQYDKNELYMTDPDGGNQVKLLESPNRIWSINYDSDSGLLLWFDNTENIVFGYSLNERKLVKKEKLNTSQSFSIFQFLNSNEMLIASYPYGSYMYTLNLNNKEMQVDIPLNLGSLSPIKIKQDHLVITNRGENAFISLIETDGTSLALNIPAGDIRGIRYQQKGDLLLVQHHNKMEIYKYSDLTLIDSINVDGAIISAEFLSEFDIGYVTLGEHKVKSSSYKYSLKHKKKTSIPALNSLWLGRLDNTTLVSLSSNDTVIMYDINSGETLQEIDLPIARYKHSIATGGGYIYHSDGEKIYRTTRGKEEELKEIYMVENANMHTIKDIRYSAEDNALWLYMIEVNDNQLLSIKLKGKQEDK
ncbi:hypothetical protein MTsN2n4_27830 [Pseudoalteromonas sp. MTN2-4]